MIPYFIRLMLTLLTPTEHKVVIVSVPFLRIRSQLTDSCCQLTLTDINLNACFHSRRMPKAYLLLSPESIYLNAGVTVFQMNNVLNA